MVDVPVVVQGPKRTRHFTFTRVNPCDVDYERLWKVAHNINADLGFKTVSVGGREVLYGFLTLHGPATIADDIGNLLPNFLVHCLVDSYLTGFDWLDAVQGYETFFFQTATFVNGKGHPFQKLKARLF